MTYLIILNALFIAITLLGGAWYSLSGDKRDRTSTMMPIILMLPRMLLVVGSLLFGTHVLGWSTDKAVEFVSIIFGIWLLIVTTEVFYVQMKLRNEKYEPKKMEEVQSKQVQVQDRTRSSYAYREYKARQRTCRI